jgi:hypothetical protein
MSNIVQEQYAQIQGAQSDLVTLSKAGGSSPVVPHRQMLRSPWVRTFRVTKVTRTPARLETGSTLVTDDVKVHTHIP